MGTPIIWKEIIWIRSIKTSKTNYVSTCKNWLQVIQVLRSPVGSWDFIPNEGCSYWRDFLGNHRCLKHSENCAMHLPHLLSKLDSLPFYPWPDLSENMTSRNIKLCLLKRAPCEHPISGEKRWKENQFFKCKAFQFRNSFTNWFPSSTSNHQRG